PNQDLTSKTLEDHVGAFHCGSACSCLWFYHGARGTTSGAVPPESACRGRSCESGYPRRHQDSAWSTQRPANQAGGPSTYFPAGANIFGSRQTQPAVSVLPAG